MLDVLNYLPPRRFIDSWSVSRFLLGGRRSTRRPRLDEVLDARLRTLIALAAERHGEPVRLVAHSLGAIIALSAVDNWPGPGRIVDLTTMGNPLMLLAERFPYIYGRARSDGGHRNTPAVRRWRNYYYNQDLIGRSLDRQLTVPAGASHVKFEPDLSLGDGTHTDYFGDPRFAAGFISVTDSTAAPELWPVLVSVARGVVRACPRVRRLVSMRAEPALMPSESTEISGPRGGSH